MAVECNPQLLMRLTETFDVDGADSVFVTFNGFDRANVAKYYSASTPPVTKCAADSLALIAAAATIDLTALTGPNGAAVTFSGLKIVAALFKNRSANSGASLTIAEGASNGYQIQGGNDVIVYRSTGRSGWNFYDFADALGDVSGTDKTLDITGTGTDILDFILLAG